MAAFVLLMLMSIHCSLCNEIHGRGLSTSNKMEIACAQLRASGCSHAIGLDLQCVPSRVQMTTKSKGGSDGDHLGASTSSLHSDGSLRTVEGTWAMKPGYRSFMAGKVRINVKRHVTPRSWDGALRVCRSEGGSLVKIDTKEKETAIIKNLKIKGLALSPVSLWMGLRYFEVKEGFLWTDETPLGYKHWGSNEPSHTWMEVDGTVSKEDCVALTVPLIFGTYWNDRSCSKPTGFICELH